MGVNTSLFVTILKVENKNLQKTEMTSTCKKSNVGFKYSKFGPKGTYGSFGIHVDVCECVLATKQMKNQGDIEEISQSEHGTCLQLLS